ncbi:MAG: hypothetical protein WBW79_14515 [Desulfocapsaceae bacterium]
MNINATRVISPQAFVNALGCSGVVSDRYIDGYFESWIAVLPKHGPKIDFTSGSMKMFRLFTKCKLLKRLQRKKRNGDNISMYFEETNQELQNRDLSIKRIKTILDAAFSEADASRRSHLLTQADLLETQLLFVYRSEGLIVTAHNIQRKIIRHRYRRQREFL